MDEILSVIARLLGRLIGRNIDCGLDCDISQLRWAEYLLIVPKSKFRLIQGEANLTTYTFGTAEAKHKFCKTCGIKSFYIPRSNPDGYDINVHCLDPQPRKIMVEEFDGKNWESHAHKLSHLSKET